MRETAIYLRQSVDRADSVSLETQEALCRQDIPPETPVNVYSDRGYSGKNTDRPALRKMLDDVHSGKIGRVLVYKLDRISRNLADFTQLLRDFETHQVEFCSYSERFETATPMGQAMQSLLMVFAQLERETISGRVRDAAFSRAKMGFDTGGPPPAGFCKIPAEILGKHTHILAPDSNAPQIAQAFSAYLKADSSLTSLCKMWNEAGFRTRRGGKWSPNTLCRVLRNPVYVQADAKVYAYLSALGAELCLPEPLPQRRGVYLYADRQIPRTGTTDLHGVLAICAPHEGLIAPEIWLACQKKLTESRKKRTRGTGEKSWLSGCIYCARCGSAMTVVHGRHADYLICGGKKRGKCSGTGAVWRKDTAEQIVGVLLAEQLQLLRETGGMPVQQPAQTALREKRDALHLRRELLLRELTNPAGAAPALLAEAAARLRQEETQLCSAIEAAERPQRINLPEWEECDAAMRKTVLQTLLHGISADGDTLYLLLK